jgi:predicted HicB family RNase H-like nuclease
MPATRSESVVPLHRKVLDMLMVICNTVISVTQLSRLKEWDMEKEGVRMVHVRLSPELHKELRVRVAEEDTSIQDWVAALIERELKRGKRE